MSIGNVNVSLIKDESLLPVPSLSETTGDKEFDALIERFRGLLGKMEIEKVPEGKEFEKAAKMASLLRVLESFKFRKKQMICLILEN